MAAETARELRELRRKNRELEATKSSRPQRVSLRGSALRYAADPRVHRRTQGPLQGRTDLPCTRRARRAVSPRVRAGVGRDAPTVIITNDHDLPAKALIEQIRPADDHRAAPRRDHPGILRRRPLQPPSTSTSTSTSSCVSWPKPSSLHSGPGSAPATPPRHTRHPPATLPRHARNNQLQRHRHDHRRPQPPRLLTGPAPSPTSPRTPPSPGGETALLRYELS